MKQELFEELLESVKEAKAIIDGEKEPSRIFIYDELDVKSIREQFGLSQSKFASLLGISPGTLRNWEQGRRKPRGIGTGITPRSTKASRSDSGYGSYFREQLMTLNSHTAFCVG